jgi:hypothetical protein
MVDCATGRGRVISHLVQGDFKTGDDLPIHGVTMTRRPSTKPRRRRLAIALPVAGATFALLAPIVLWTRYGDGDPIHSLQVAVVAAIIAWTIARRAEDRDVAAARPTARHVAHETGCRPHRSTRSSSRSARDVGCATAAEHQLERRPVRRRSRP